MRLKQNERKQRLEETAVFAVDSASDNAEVNLHQRFQYKTHYACSLARNHSQHCLNVKCEYREYNSVRVNSLPRDLATAIYFFDLPICLY